MRRHETQPRGNWHARRFPLGLAIARRIYENVRDPRGAALALLNSPVWGFRSRRGVSLRRLRLGRIPGSRVHRFERLVADEDWVSASAVSGAEGVPSAPEEFGGLGYSTEEAVFITSNPRVSGVVSGDSFLLSPNNLRPFESIPTSNPPVSGFLSIRKQHLLLRVRKSEGYPCGIFVGSDSPHNWFHWLVDTLPSVYLARFLPQQFNEVPLLVPEVALRRDHWLESLKAVSDGRPIRPISSDAYHLVGELLWIHGPTAKRHVHREELHAEFAIERNTILEFRDVLLAELASPIPPPGRPPRIYLARLPGSLRPYNQDELLAIAEKYGFRAVYLENHSLTESLSLLSRAEYIIGPHGAGWAQALFAKSAKGAMLWTWNEAATENWFHNVLALAGIPCETLFTGPGSNSSPYILDAGGFEESLSRMLDSLG